MREIRLIFKIMLLVLICVACEKSSKQQYKLPQLALQNEEYFDSINNLKLSLMLPKETLIDSVEKRHLVEVAYFNTESKDNSLLEVALSDYINCKTTLEVLYITPNIISAKVETNNWVEGGDTLSTFSYLTYMRQSKTRLMLDDIVSTAKDVDELMNMITDKSENKSEHFSPDVDVTILGENLVFHYDRHKQQPIDVSLPIKDVVDKFNKLKRIYNE